MVELCKGADQSALSDESRSAFFSSLVHIVVLSYQTGAVDDMVAHYSTLLAMIPKVTRNEGAEAIDSVLNAVSNSADFQLLTRVYSITSAQLARMPDTERMLFNVDMKLCKSYIERHDYGNAQRVLDRLHHTCKLHDGSDDRRNKGAELIEIYALSIKISFATGDSLKMKVRHTPRNQHVRQPTTSECESGSWLRDRRSAPHGTCTDMLNALPLCVVRLCTRPRRT